MQDVVIALTLLRAQGHRIPLLDTHRFYCWMAGCAELIAQLPSQDQRMAWVVLIADDLCQRAPGMPLAIAAQPLLNKLRELEESRV